MPLKYAGEEANQNSHSSLLPRPVPPPLNPPLGATPPPASCFARVVANAKPSAVKGSAINQIPLLA
jgi:hypothetical protein